MRKKELLQHFKIAYDRRLFADRHRLFGCFKHSHLKLDQKDPKGMIYQILKHGIYGGGKRTQRVLKDLGWINANNEINFMLPPLRKAEDILVKEMKNTKNKALFNL